MSNRDLKNLKFILAGTKDEKLQRSLELAIETFEITVLKISLTECEKLSFAEFE